MTVHVICTKKNKFKTWRNQVDDALGYPEDIAQLKVQGKCKHGPGKLAPQDLGKAKHFHGDKAKKDKITKKYAVPFSDTVEVPEDDDFKVGELPPECEEDEEWDGNLEGEEEQMGP